MAPQPEQKRDALKKLLKGEITQDQALKGLGAVLDVTVMEHTDTHTLIIIERIPSKMKNIPNEEVQAFMEQLAKDNPTKKVVPLHIAREEYIRISEELEATY